MSPLAARWRNSLGLAATCCLLMAQIGCNQDNSAGQSAQDQQAVQVTAVRPLKMMLVEWDEYTGRLDAIDFVEVRSRVSGYLESLHFDEGQMVSRGDLLAIIDPRPFEAEVTAAKASETEATAQVAEAQARQSQSQAEKANADAQLGLAQQRFRRVEQLRNTGAITEEEYDVRRAEYTQSEAAVKAATAGVKSAEAAVATAEAAVARASANLAAAQLELDYTRIRAPVDGRISRRYATRGNLVSGGSSLGTLLTTIVSLKPIHVYFDANEQEFLKYQRLAADGTRESSREVKNPVFVALVDEQGFPHQGHMDFVDNRVDPNTGTMRGRAILPNDDLMLTPGLFAKVRLPGSGRYEAILVPDTAINSDQADTFVYVATGEGSFERRDVKLGPIAHGLRIIRNGLDGSEMVITAGMQMLRPGSKIEVTESQVEAKPSPLPDDYTPVPKDQWLSQPPEPAPGGIEARSSVLGESPSDPAPQAGQGAE